jgi:hypothetical protein
MLSITTPRTVENAADRCLGSIGDLIDAAATGNTQQFEQAVNDTRQPRNDLRAARGAQLTVITD